MRILKIGTRMGGYQLLGLIARGGMGAVYEALEIQLERRVALKVIAPPNPDDHDAEELVQRFMQEARTLARVNHPNVITIYAIDTAQDVPFITMELVEGISFKEMLAVYFLSADLAAPMFIQMLEGLQCLHANRIVHRDLKPHNVMVRKDGQIKILDFGIAKPVDSGHFTHVGVVVGSLAYMAPEVKLGIAATERSDLWNLGAIFYESLTGKALPKVMHDNPNAKEIPYAANSPVPQEMRAIIAKLCHVKPLERYESCEQAIEDLKAFQRKRAPVAADVMHAFSRKVEEILAKRRGDSKDLPAADIMPVQAPALPDSPSSLSTYRRERTYTTAGRPRRKKNKLNRRYVGAAALAAILFMVFLLKPKFDAQKQQEPALAAQSPPKRKEAKPLKFKPPPTDVETLVKPSLELVGPASEEIVALDPSAIPTLTWSRDLKQNEYEIQVSTDRAFAKVLLNEPVSGTSYRPARVLPEGKYYWRLTPKNGEGDAVGPLRFTLMHVQPVQLQSPSEAEAIAYGAKEKGAPVDFSWKCKAGAESYQIQIAVGPKFVSRDNATQDCSWHEKSLPAGIYRWRVRTMNKSVPWSDSREFTVAKRSSSPAEGRPGSLAFGKPQLGESANRFTFKFKGSPRDLASVVKAVVEYPELKWEKVKGAQKYLLQLSESREFAKLTDEFTLTETKFEWKKVLPGVYYWRVAAIGEKQGPFSERGQLTVLLPAPKLKAKYKFETLSEGDRQVINWPFVPLAEKYLVQFGGKRDLASAEQQVVSASKFPLPKKHGQYFIRVAAGNAAGEAIGPFSPTSSVSVQPVATLETPTPKLPKAGSSASFRKGRVSITFEWSEIPKAERYVIEIARDEDFTAIVEKFPSQQTTHLLKKLGSAGKFFWRVRAENKVGVSSWSDPSAFEIKK